jgi:hypothetical protein
LALDCSKGHVLRASPFSILLPSYPETTGESSQKCKISRLSADLADSQHAHYPRFWL